MQSQHGVLTSYDKSLPLVLRLPVNVHLRIWDYLHPIERACFSLASRHLIYLLNKHSPRIALSVGSPLSHNPLCKELGCRHCVPALYSPAHCELHFHLRSLFPRHLTYCYNCEMFTSHEKKGYSDSGEYCGICTAKYSRMFERGRRHIGNLDEDFGMVEAGVEVRRGGSVGWPTSARIHVSFDLPRKDFWRILAEALEISTLAWIEFTLEAHGKGEYGMHELWSETWWRWRSLCWAVGISPVSFVTSW
ncbi:hypothetical protein MBM_09039 [Drepanopeziza brunnea f. sp. 'multigermtubi' MB_m1]|uniref:F-box domain-containing protein n=1 Tax=Marssonina brunnea f. sp. multigermtubi (strain MB_m1) TaxID=1072389 RepID=K1W6Z3_MARBU|nr:uncharacterized protein MBM_09039 [Drepanopeziza brunnea f. sp. 'multigermtubi' MB_m1]EKD12810.1 hypothetical protein MBM_09039 [Drepanopeziza brunnea f. sp. 'multigermtubi' MB_m1]